MALADQLRAHRENRGLSQAAVADQLNVSRQSVSKWETGVSHSKGYNQNNPCLACLQRETFK